MGEQYRGYSNALAQARAAAEQGESGYAVPVPPAYAKGSVTSSGRVYDADKEPVGAELAQMQAGLSILREQLEDLEHGLEKYLAPKDSDMATPEPDSLRREGMSPLWYQVHEVNRAVLSAFDVLGRIKRRVQL